MRMRVPGERLRAGLAVGHQRFTGIPHHPHTQYIVGKAGPVSGQPVALPPAFQVVICPMGAPCPLATAFPHPLSSTETRRPFGPMGVW